MIDIFLACEDPLAQACGEKLIASLYPTCTIKPMPRGGNSKLRSDLSKFIEVAQRCPVLLLTDLDQMVCAPSLVQTWTKNQPLPARLLFRVAVRETESWLLADREGFSAWSGVPVAQLPLNPDAEPDPKRLLLERIKRYSQRNMKEDLLPAAGSISSKVGLSYNARLTQFVRQHWSLENAMQHSDSLARAHMRLQELYI